jgi:hypothetical protein
MAIALQDRLATVWLRSQLERQRLCAGDRAEMAIVVITQHTLRRVHWEDETDTAVPKEQSIESVLPSWLWFECSVARNMQVSMLDENRLPFAFDPMFSRHIAIATPPGLEELLKSNGWPTWF